VPLLLSLLLLPVLTPLLQRLNTVIILDAGMAFNGAWAMIKKLLDDVTAAKATFTTSDDLEQNLLERGFGHEITGAFLLLVLLGLLLPLPLTSPPSADWVLKEAAENRAATGRLPVKKHWEWLDEAGQPKEHDARGVGAFLTSEHYKAAVHKDFCQSLQYVHADTHSAEHGYRGERA